MSEAERLRMLEVLDRLLHHAQILKCGPRSWRTRAQTSLRTQEAVR